MSAQVVVFLGPTLPRAEARAVLKAHYLPPAEQGHMVEAVRETSARTIVLIDGAFATVPSVRHKEILWALSQGVEVIGAASIGALRAAELAGFGMLGFGLVYRWYRATPLADDDEVAVAMMPRELGAGALGEALINMRVTLRRAEVVGIITADARRFLVDVARSIHFLDRSYQELLNRARARGPARRAPQLDALEAWIPDHSVDQKQRDAIGLLRHLASRPLKRGTRPSMNCHPFTLTEAMARDLEAGGNEPI